jgi:hypothetical protein
MGVDHRRSDAPVTKKLLNGSDVVTIFKQVRCKRMPKRMAGVSLGKRGG